MKFNCENQNMNQNEIGKMFKILRFLSLFAMIIFSIFLIHSTVVVKTEFNKSIKISKDRQFHLNNHIKDIVKTKDRLIRKITPKLKSNEDFEDVQLNKIVFNEEMVIPEAGTINQLIEELEVDKLLVSSLNSKEDEFFDI